MQTQLTSKGQLVIPKAIREKLALSVGSRFETKVIDGNILLKPVLTKTNSIRQWSAKNPKDQHLTLEDLCKSVTLAD